MLNKLSFKIGLLFFVFIVILESLLFFALYTDLADDRIDETMSSLLARGNSHSSVLEDNFNQTTLEHVALMESASDFIVIITDASGNVLTSSDPVEPEMANVIEHTGYHAIPEEGRIVDDRWEEEEYISTDSPITINEEHRGHVFMFAGTSTIKNIVNQLGEQFFIVGLITIGLTIAAIFILTRVVTLPLVKMKEATEQLSRGNNRVELQTERSDELGELASSISKLSNDLEYMKKERNEFLASISHELRTPLTYIKGYADILNRQHLSEPEIEEYTAIIREETEQLTSLVKNLFELAKMDENKFVINREKVNFYKLIENVKTLVGPAFAEREVELLIRCPENVTAFVDPDRFQQVLINIFDNAKKHSFQGGEVRLEVSQTRKDVTIVISDGGEGIPEQDLPYVFDRLYRVDKSRSRKSGGTGLGLAVTKEIVESHGGNMEVLSELGEGTSVIITIPRGEENEKGLTG